MAKVFVIDVEKCVGCCNCQIACKDEHCEQPWLPYAEAQPMTGQFWMNVRQRERGQVPVVKVAYTPTPCSHCESAACMAAAEGGAVYRREDGLVLIDPEKAKGQRAIADACPAGAAFWNEALDLPQKCTGCAHLLDDGWSVPRCVDACPTDALLFGDEEEFAAEIASAECLPELGGMGARAYYLNLPKRFVAGGLVDFSEDEVVIGAKVELLDGAGNVVETTETDEFGDFMFGRVEPSAYAVRITAEGFDALEVGADVTEKDLSLGYLSVR